MHRLRLVVLLALLVPSLQIFAAGDNQCTQQGIADKFGLSLEDISLAEPLSPPVYVSFPGDLAIGDEVAFEVTLDGAPFLAETLELVASEISGENRTRSENKVAEEGRPVVEFLAGQPQRLTVLHHLGERQQVDITTLHNGEIAEKVSLQDLVAQSEILSAGPLDPFALQSTVVIQAPAPPAENYTCVEICDLELDYCINNQCGGGGTSCTNYCEQQYVDCLEGCGFCVPSSTSTTTYSTVSVTPTSTYECHTSSVPGWSKGIWRLYTKRIKKTVTTTTINNDCTQTVTTQITYFNLPCWVWQYSEPYCYSYGPISNFC